MLRTEHDHEHDNVGKSKDSPKGTLQTREDDGGEGEISGGPKSDKAVTPPSLS